MASLMTHGTLHVIIIITSAVTRTRLAPSWHTSRGNTPQPPPWHPHALQATPPTTAARIRSRPGPLLPLSII